jgi:predicted lipid-binding transport protein (Tim44 family)
VTTLAIAADTAVGRVGGGKSFGSRGTKTHTAPMATNLAKRTAALEVSMTDRRAPALSSAKLSRHRGLTALLRGELSAAVNAVLGRNQPACVPARGSATTSNRSPYIFMNGPAAPVSPLAIGKDDFACFERLLGEIQTAYGREDTEELGARTTPEMFSHFSRDLYDNARQGRRHDLADIEFLAGELSEAWSENGSDYATVAMSYSLVDATVDRATGTVISGNAGQAYGAVELWTFRRDIGVPSDGWELSAIQQTG